MTFRKNDVRIGAWSSLAGGGTAQVLASTCPDWLVLDAQHGTYDDLSMRTTLDLLDPWRAAVPCWVRLPDDAPWAIGRALDAGAAGVIVPMVNTAEQAERVVRAASYPPRGQRSWGPIPALTGRPAPDAPTANATVGVAVMIETALAVENIAAIAATPDLDMIFVGPFDLALAIGTTLDDLLAQNDGTLDRIVAACRAHGVRAGVFAGNNTRAEGLVARGFTDVVALTDSGLLAEAALTELARWRGEDEPTTTRTAY